MDVHNTHDGCTHTRWMYTHGKNVVIIRGGAKKPKNQTKPN